MKHLGLIKWFDDVKGFGRIGTPHNGEVFVHHNNLSTRPEKLSKGTALIFEIQKGNRGTSAINAELPNSYEDFKAILAYLKENPSISIEETITGESKWGNRYRKPEFKLYNLIGYSLHQLLRNKQATTIFEFFKNYFDEQYTKGDSEFATKYLTITKSKIKGLTLELNDFLLEEFKANHYTLPNNFLIQKLFIYYLDKIDIELYYEIWKNKIYQIDSDSLRPFREDLKKEIFFEFPAEMFLNNYLNINSSDLNRILNQSNGAQIIIEIIKKKIATLESISKTGIEEILKSIQLVEKSEIANELRNLFTTKLLDLMSKLGFADIKRETVETFKIFLETLNNKTGNLNYESTIKKFNESVSDKTKFALWQATRYYKPEKDFFLNNQTQLSHDDFLKAPEDYHKEYFSNNINRIGEFNTLESFCKITFLIVETPYAAIEEIFSKLETKYQAAYWLNFPKTDNYSGKSYEANYEKTNIPFNNGKLISYIEKQSSIRDLIVAYSLVARIKEAYNSKLFNFLKSQSFFKLNEDDQKEIIDKFILHENDISNEKIVELFITFLKRNKNEDAILLSKCLFPKFVNEKIISIDELSSKILNLDIDEITKNSVLSYIGEKTSKFYAVKFWLNGYTNKINFEDIIEVFDKFSSSEQVDLFRKLFTLIQRNKATQNESYSAKLYRLLANPKLNLNIRICLSVINSLKNQYNYIDENIISEIVCQYVNENASDLIRISDLLEECQGRTWMTNTQEIRKYWLLKIEGKEFYVDNDTVNINGRHYPFDKENKTVLIENEAYSFSWSKREYNTHAQLYDRPAGITFCDAVRSQNDDTLNRKFFWCCNSKCYAPCQNDHIHLEWRNYSLRDFIKILNLSFDEDKYYRFVGIINRANRLLKKLKCCSCNRLLRDAKTSEFAFYRVTTFHCTNPECPELHKIVYLNHCLNWKCLNVVDSRISTTCPNGWYICDSCEGCCSQGKLERRLNNLMTTGAFNSNNSRHQKLKFQVDNKLGHMEKGEKFNYKTGEKTGE